MLIGVDTGSPQVQRRFHEAGHGSGFRNTRDGWGSPRAGALRSGLPISKSRTLPRSSFLEYDQHQAGALAHLLGGGEESADLFQVHPRNHATVSVRLIRTHDSGAIQSKFEYDLVKLLTVLALR